MKAYVVGLITVDDQARYSDYIAHSPASIAQYGGRVLIRNGPKYPLDGAPLDERLVVVEFPSVDDARRWYESDEYQAIVPIRLGASHGSLCIVEGYSG